MSPRIADIHRAVEHSEKCRARHVTSVLVIEKRDGEEMFDGMVEVFDLEDHPQAKRAHAWQRRTGKKPEDAEYKVVLGIPPVNSAEDAVKAAIVAIYRSL